jgi:hypothetical protein
LLTIGYSTPIDFPLYNCYTLSIDNREKDKNMNLIENKVDFLKLIKKLNKKPQSKPETTMKHFLMWGEWKFGKSIEDIAKEYDMSYAWTKEIVTLRVPSYIWKMNKDNNEWIIQ